MSQKTHFLSEVLSGDQIPENKLAYFEQRALNSFYDFVIRKFEEERLNSHLTKAKLASRIGRGPDQVNRWLASPSNWTIGTVARLLVGIAGEEPALSSRKLTGRDPQNISVMSLLDDDIVASTELVAFGDNQPKTKTSIVVEIRKMENAPL